MPSCTHHLDCSHPRWPGSADTGEVLGSCPPQAEATKHCRQSAARPLPPPLAKVFEECATAASKGRSQAQSVTLLVVDCDPISLTSLSHGSRCHVVDLHADPYGWNSR